MVCEKLKMNFDLREIRKHGIELLMVVLFLTIQISGNGGDLRRCRMARRSRTELSIEPNLQ
jgi:hypothetical protein